MSEPGSSLERAIPGKAVARREEPDESRLVVDVSTVARWFRGRGILLAGLLIILVAVIWKGQFLSHMYFSQDDYVDLDIASKASFDWHYLSLVGAGHLYPGLRAVAWVLARISLYNWGLDAGVALALVAASSVAALRLLRTLFGDRPAILIPLAIYLLTPLTVPDLGWWWCAMESLPLQLSIFMTLNAHVHYVRTGRWRHLLAASLWLVIGMLFFEKAFVLVPLLFAITASYLMPAKSFVAGVISTLRQHWKAWTVYGALMSGYLIMFVLAFKSSAQQPSMPSVSAGWTFASTLLKETLLTGAIGGPWHWFPIESGVYALVAPPTNLVWLSGLIAVGVVVASVLRRWIAWRAWAILFGWVLCADVVPILIGRQTLGLAGLLGLETRYLAEAACVLAICVGLAFLPVSGVRQTDTSTQGHRAANEGQHGVLRTDQGLRYAAAGLVAMFVISSVWSVQAFEASTPGVRAVRTYVANARQAVKSAPRGGLNILDQYMPQQIVTGVDFGVPAALESTVIGDLARGKLAGRLHWIRNLPSGTIDGLWMFGNDGQLYPAEVSGVYTVARKGQGPFGFCWPKKRNGVTFVKFPRTTTSVYDWTLHISYLWGAAPSFVTVTYGKSVQQLAVLPRAHSAYLHVQGNVSSFTVSGPGASALCVADAQAGELVPYGKPIR
jgi:hypothetical protein